MEYKHNGGIYKGEWRMVMNETATDSGDPRKAPVKSKIYGLIELGLDLGAILSVAIVFCMFLSGSILAADVLLSRWTGSVSHVAIIRSAINAGNGGAATYLGLAISFLAYASAAGAVCAVAWIRAGADWRDPIAWRPWSPRRAGRGFWLIAGAAFLYGFAADFALVYFYPPSEAWLAMPKDPLAAALLAFLAVGFAPVVEELVFRGWIFTRLRKDFSFAAALFATSIVFAGLHYESTHLYALAVFPSGLALGAMREITGGIKAPIAFHAFNNLVASGLGLLDFG